MTFRVCIWSALLMLFSVTGTLAQQSGSDPFRDAEGNTWHQLFLDFQATEIMEMHYLHETDEIKGELSPDGYSVTFRNYDGKRAVFVKLKDPSGVIHEITKSKCFIDPVLLNL